MIDVVDKLHLWVMWLKITRFVYPYMVVMIVEQDVAYTDDYIKRHFL